MALGTLLAILGLGLQVGGSIYSASKQAEEANANAQQAEDQAKKEREAGKRREDQYRRQGERFMSSQRALYATSGIRMDEGSALDVMKDSASEIELDAQAIRAGADATAGYYLNQAKQDREQAGTIKTAGFISAGTSLLTGFGKYHWGEKKCLKVPAHPQA